MLSHGCVASAAACIGLLNFQPYAVDEVAYDVQKCQAWSGRPARPDSHAAKLETWRRPLSFRSFRPAQGMDACSKRPVNDSGDTRPGTCLLPKGLDEEKKKSFSLSSSPRILTVTSFDSLWQRVHARLAGETLAEWFQALPVDHPVPSLGLLRYMGCTSIPLRSDSFASRDTQSPSLLTDFHSGTLPPLRSATNSKDSPDLASESRSACLQVWSLLGSSLIPPEPFQL